jgi:isochorismate synthase
METMVDKKIDLKNLWSAVMAKNGSIAVWRCPRENVIHFLADLSESPEKGRINLQNVEQGFLVSPFMNPEGNETLFLRSDVYANRMGNGS